MKADWKKASEVLPEKRIRVIVCDSIGFIQTAFYGYQSTGRDDKTCWRSDTIPEERILKDCEVMWWDYFPDPPERNS